MPTEIKKRFDRILSIFIQLQTTRIITAATLSARYEVSLRTIYRDIQALIAAGIPIYGEAGTGYTILSEYRMPIMPFTREEGLSLLAAEKLVAKYMDRNLGAQFASAIAKMKASLRPSEKLDLFNADPAIIVRMDRDTFNQQLPEGLSLLIEGIASRKAVHLIYQKPSSDTTDKRIVEPVGIFIEGRFWYVMAYCQLRQDYRQFRLDRIQHLQLSSAGFQGEHPTLAYFLEKKEAIPKKHFVIRIERSIAHYLHWDRKHYGYIGEQLIGEEVEMRFETNMPDEGFVRWFLMFADHAKIVEPKALVKLAGRIMEDSTRKLNQRK